MIGRQKTNHTRSRSYFVIIVIIILAACFIFWKRGASRALVDYPSKQDVLILVNRDHPIPDDWTVDLVSLPNGQMVDKRIYQPLMKMFEAARDVNQGQLPNVESGYRSEERQRELYEQKIVEYVQQGYSYEEATTLAEKWVSIPGTSEHQLGIAVDISGEVYDIYPWLQENSYKYGFVLRYPPEKTAITGVSGEEWHYRYVGVEAATEMYEQGLCLEEYLERAKN